MMVVRLNDWGGLSLIRLGALLSQNVTTDTLKELEYFSPLWQRESDNRGHY